MSNPLARRTSGDSLDRLSGRALPALVERAVRDEVALVQGRGIVQGARTQAVEYVAHSALRAVEDLTAMETLAMERNPLGDARYKAIVDAATASLNADLGNYFGTDKGVLVLSTDDTLKALKPGDVVQQVAGQSVERPEDALRLLRDQPTGSEVKIQVLRQHKPVTLSMKAPEWKGIFVPRPPTAPLPPAPPAPPTPPSARVPPPPPAPPAPPAPPGGEDDEA